MHSREQFGIECGGSLVTDTGVRESQPWQLEFKFTCYFETENHWHFQLFKILFFFLFFGMNDQNSLPLSLSLSLSLDRVMTVSIKPGAPL